MIAVDRLPPSIQDHQQQLRHRLSQLISPELFLRVSLRAALGLPVTQFFLPTSLRPARKQRRTDLIRRISGIAPVPPGKVAP